MSEWIKWFFDGLGTELISLIIGALFGGMVVFRIGKHKIKLHQAQVAGIESSSIKRGVFVKNLIIQNPKMKYLSLHRNKQRETVPSKHR